MNSTDLESPEQFGCLFLTSLHKIKLHIFQTISKCLVHGIRPFKYNNTCDLCVILQDKENRVNLWRRNVLFFTGKLLMSLITNFKSPQYKTVISS